MLAGSHLCYMLYCKMAMQCCKGFLLWSKQPFMQGRNSCA